MLLRSETNTHFYAELSLFFDDSTQKTVSLNEGDFVIIKIRYDGDKLLGVAKIIQVMPILNTSTGHTFCVDCKLVLDLARQFDSSRITISTSDVLDIKAITKEAAMDLYNAGEDLVITDEMFKPDPVEDIDPGMGVVPEEPSTDNNIDSSEEELPSDSENTETLPEEPIEDESDISSDEGGEVDGNN